MLPDVELRSILERISATKHLDLRWVSAEDRALMKRAIEKLHVERGISAIAISAMIGKSESYTWKLCRILGV